MKIEFFEQRGMVQRAVAERLRSGMTVFGEYLLFERAGVYAYPDRDIAAFARVGNRLYPVVRADVAGIDAYFIHARGASLERKLIVKVDVGDYGHADRLL